MRRVLFAAILLALLTGCAQPTNAVTEGKAEAPTQAPANDRQEIHVAGSTTVQPLAEKLAEAYTAKNPGAKINVQGGGSSVGVKSAGEGQVEIGMASREVKPSERDAYQDMKVLAIAYDGIALVAHPGVAVSNVTKEQAAKIFGGEITNWREIGGPDSLIVVVSREEGSGTRAAFEELVMGETLIAGSAILLPSNGAVRTTMSTTPNAIGYLSFGYLDNTVQALQVDGVAPTAESAKNGSYPVVRPLNMMTKGEPQGEAKSYLDFILSDDGQALVVEEGYLSVR